LVIWTHDTYNYIFKKKTTKLKMIERFITLDHGYWFYFGKFWIFNWLAIGAFSPKPILSILNNVYTPLYDLIRRNYVMGKIVRITQTNCIMNQNNKIKLYTLNFYCSEVIKMNQKPPFPGIWKYTPQLILIYKNIIYILLPAYRFNYF